MASIVLRRSLTVLLSGFGALSACSPPAYGGPPADMHTGESARMAQELGYPDAYDEPPKPERVTRPTYPKPAFESCIEGTVVILIGIDTQGKVSAARIVESIKGLDEAALACVKSWRFKAATKAGVAVGTVAVAPVAFRIYDDNNGKTPRQCQGKTRAPLQ